MTHLLRTFTYQDADILTYLQPIFPLHVRIPGFCLLNFLQGQRMLQPLLEHFLKLYSKFSHFHILMKVGHSAQNLDVKVLLPSTT